MGKEKIKREGRMGKREERKKDRKGDLGREGRWERKGKK